MALIQNKCVLERRRSRPVFTGWLAGKELKSSRITFEVNILIKTSHSESAQQGHFCRVQVSLRSWAVFIGETVMCNRYWDHLDNSGDPGTEDVSCWIPGRHTEM